MNRKAIALKLTALASHYYRPDFSPAQAQQLIADMVEDLEEFTIAEIEVAVRNYRRNPENRFFPRAADLRGLVLGDRKERRISASKPGIVPEFGDHRPLAWETLPRRYWQPHWKADDLRLARDPERLARYESWLVRVKAGAVEGKNPNEY